MNLLLFQHVYTGGRLQLEGPPAMPALVKRLEGVLGLKAGLGIRWPGASGLKAIPNVGARYAVRTSPPRPPGDSCMAHPKKGRPTKEPPIRELSQGESFERQLAMPAGEQADGGVNAAGFLRDFLHSRGRGLHGPADVVAKGQGMDSLSPISGPNTDVLGLRRAGRQISDDSVLGGEGREMMRNWLEAKVKRAAARPLPKSRQEMEARKAHDRKRFLQMMGLDPLPTRTPLNARITGVVHRPGYRIEKLVFESRPGFHVTAHLYIPEPSPSLSAATSSRQMRTSLGGGGGESLAPSPSPPSDALRESVEGRSSAIKYPVILDVHGHWPVKKQTEVVQSRAVFQALRGYVAVVIDSPGYSFEAADAPIERRWQGDHNDEFLLLGSANTTALYAWDVTRTLDYLETRPECDTSRVGITGASGGGLATVYTFVADERIKCAVPVVYATSLEVNPHNGCLCNHVPATLQVGDRSDLLALRAPSPILVIGAEVDPEFPPEGTKRTGEKLTAIWKLYGKEDDARWIVFPGGHDYSRPMRELAMGFFDKHLKGIGDGSPVPEPEFTPIPNRDAELLVLPDFSLRGANSPNPPNAKTQRDIARERLASAKPVSWEKVVELNGGRPHMATELGWNARDARQSEKGVLPRSRKSYVTYQSEEGLTIPGIEWSKGEGASTVVVLLDESGKAAAFRNFSVQALLDAGHDCLALDVRGFGELQGLDPRLMAYLGTASAFAMGWDAAVAAKALIERGRKVVVVGRGATGSQVAMFASLFEPRISGVIGLQGLQRWEDAFAGGVPGHCVMPRADLVGPLSHLRSLVACPSLWTFRGAPEPPLVEAVRDLLGKSQPSAQGPHR